MGVTGWVKERPGSLLLAFHIDMNPGSWKRSFYDSRMEDTPRILCGQIDGSLEHSGPSLGKEMEAEYVTVK